MPAAVLSREHAASRVWPPLLPLGVRVTPLPNTTKTPICDNAGRAFLTVGTPVAFLVITLGDSSFPPRPQQRLPVASRGAEILAGQFA